jgi:hypothetical protein
MCGRNAIIGDGSLALWLALAWLLPVALGAAAGSVPQSEREIPVVRQADVLVVGGTLGAVAAAVEAAEGGARVFLAAPRPYLGEDQSATLRLWRDEPPRGELTEKVFAGRSVTTPMRVKQTLEAALVSSGVDFLLSCYPTDVLVDAGGGFAGVVLANRAGRQAVVAKVLIDATDRAVVAKMAGAKHRPWRGGTHACRRVVMGGNEGRQEASQEILSGVKLGGKEVFYYEYVLDLDLGDGSFPAIAAAEQHARDLTYREGQVRASERITFLPPDGIIGRRSAEQWQQDSPWQIGHFQSGNIDRVYVLGPAADLPPAAAERIAQAGPSEAAGRQVGREAAATARGLKPPERVRVRSLAERAPAHSVSADVREVLAGLRPTDRPARTVTAPSRSVPVLAEVDVLVVGGGTSGACAAIGAARRGAKALVVEYQEGLGGVGTVGLIGKAYHGRDAGFTREVPFCDAEHNNEYKMEWFRRQVRSAGGEVWLGALGCGAVVEGNRVVGALVATPLGRGAVLGRVVIDATGNGDVCVAAGAASMYGCVETDLALQGTGLPTRPPGKSYVNTDYLLVDESDLIDTWRALVGARLAAQQDAYDMGTFIQTRERRRIVGDHVLAYLDQIAGRTYPDSIVFSGSDYDSHGYPSEPFFALIPHTQKTLKANHPAPGGTCYTPYRCLLPGGLEGVLVTGLAISMHRDASAMVRMQKDMHNQGYAAGVAAAMAVENRCTPRQIDVKSLQKHLVEIGNLPESVLTDADSFPLLQADVAAAVAQIADGSQKREAVCKALAIVLSHADLARPEIEARFASAAGDQRLAYAKVLGFLGCPKGVRLLIEELRRAGPWDAKVFQGVMAEYAHLPTPIDALILALGYSGDRRATGAILERLAMLDAETTLSHHRSVALALERLGDPAAAGPLAELLQKPAVRGHAMTSLEPLYDQPVEKRRREGALREIVLARALFRCGDCDRLGETILREYQRDLRGLFARHATAILHAGGP